MQESNGVLAGSKQTIGQWSKQLIKHLILLSHSQWLFQNFTLHHKTKGYLHKKAERDIKQEILALLNTRPSDIPTAYKYLLEIEHQPGKSSSHKFQRYCVCSMKAACMAVDKEQARLAALGARALQVETGWSHRYIVGRHLRG